MHTLNTQLLPDLVSHEEINYILVYRHMVRLRNPVY